MVQKQTSPKKVEIFKNNLKKLDVVILAGGFGTRLAPIVSDKPKGLADINGKPLLHIVVENLLSYGFRRIILAVGHKKEQIIKYFSEVKFSDYSPYEIVYSSEKIPLGTGGALKLALAKVNSENCLVINGDCLYDLDFNQIYRAHLKKNAIVTMTLVKVEDSATYGAVTLAADNKLKSFSEKLVKGNHLVSAGVYFMHKKILKHFPRKKQFSLENDVFPSLCGLELYGYPIKGSFYDIGVPERYLKVKDFM